MLEQPVQERKRTRAAVLRDKVVIRLAGNEHGLLIAELLKENGIDLPATDWSQVSSHWLIATVEENVIGCVMVIPTKPIAFLEFLFVSPSAPFKLRAIAVRKLALQGMQTLMLAGCSWAFGTIAREHQAWGEILAKNGAVPVGNVAMVAKRLKV